MQTDIMRMFQRIVVRCDVNNKILPMKFQLKYLRESTKDLKGYYLRDMCVICVSYLLSV